MLDMWVSCIVGPFLHDVFVSYRSKMYQCSYLYLVGTYSEYLIVHLLMIRETLLFMGI